MPDTPSATPTASATPTVEATPSPETEGLIDETIKHAKSGYDNAQNVIKLIDAKAGILIGLSTLAAGFLVSAAKWYVEIDPTKGAACFLAAVGKHPTVVLWIAGLGVASLVTALVCIGACVWSVIARSRARNLQTPFSVLFPYYLQRQEAQATEFFRGKLRGMSKTEILVEYEDQLRVLGLILSKKLKHNRVASVAFLAQLSLLSFIFILLLAMYVL